MNGSADDDKQAEDTQPGTQAEATLSPEDVLEELNRFKREAAEMLDTAQRARAELANTRRRFEQEQERTRQRAAERLLLRLLPVADDFDRALRSIPPDQQETSWVEGMRLIERKLWNVLDAEGISPMESVGQPFDPSLHEAVMVDDSGAGADAVVEEFQKGYFLNGTVLRPAMVKVGALPKTTSD